MTGLVSVVFVLTGLSALLVLVFCFFNLTCLISMMLLLPLFFFFMGDVIGFIYVSDFIDPTNLLVQRKQT